MKTKQAVAKMKVYGTSKLRKPPLDFFPRCPGCTHGLAGKAVMEVLEEMNMAGNAIFVVGIGCHSTLMPEMKLDAVQNAHGASPSVATGVKHAHFGKRLVFTIQGDGDCAAIGAGYLLNAAFRAEKITVIMVNNTLYGTTGGQLAPTTLMGQYTSTTPDRRQPQHGYPAHIPELLATMKGVAYSVRVALNSPANYQRAKKALRTAFEIQMDNVGFGFIEMLSLCPPNLRLTPVESLKYMDDVMMAEYPLGEFKNVRRIE